MFSRLSFAQSLGASFDAAFRIALARAAGNAGGHALAIPERFGGGVFYDGNRNGIMKWDPFWGGNQIKQCEAKIYGDFEGFHL